MKQNILIFGSNSFLAKTFNQEYGSRFNIQNVYRANPEQELNFDFENDPIENIALQFQDTYQAILFFQGVNPSVGARDMTADHFNRMLKVNVSTPALLVKQLAGRLTEGALILFISSIAKKKGSYDPAYASAKSALPGLMYSLANAYPHLRFNIISPGLIEGSPVFKSMTRDFRQKHADKMGGKFISASAVITAACTLIMDKSINLTDMEIDGGYQ